jgi:anti-sigma factor RsiW
MNCQKFGEKLSAYIDGELDYEARAELEAHLLGCAACSRQLEEMRKLESFKPLLEPPKVPQEKWSECWEEIKKQTTDSLSADRVRERVARRRRVHLLRRIVLGAAGVAAAVVVAAMLLWPAAPADRLLLPPTEESVCVNEYDDSQYSLYIIDKPGYTIIKLVPLDAHEGG